ncbi:hypothetical protein OS493_024576 [Desmophyllum pertusum]|uniref:Uncharacterized protein n=1 Tax=Desmophyllum pertusum TaxID=174260 RepID=A0A9X0DA34_9CNID|nr:hypothetical protein OS493_024576 [Desmophyllum pertusum]
MQKSEMASQSTDEIVESEAESEPEIKEDKSETSEGPSISHENPPHDDETKETEEQDQIQPMKKGRKKLVFTQNRILQKKVETHSILLTDYPINSQN